LPPAHSIHPSPKTRHSAFTIHNSIVIWFRRDLRLADNPALHAAARPGLPVVPLFIVDEELIASLPCDGAAFEFQAECLRSLDAALKKVNARLIVRRGDPLAIHTALINKLHPSALYFNSDTDPAATPRDTAVRALYEQAGATVHTFHECTVHHPDEVLTQNGTPFSVFTPFANAWKKLPVPAVLPPPARLETPDVIGEAIPGARELGKRVAVTTPIARGGIEAAEQRWMQFCSSMIGDYAEHRDLPAVDGTSRMSMYLRFGCISVRRMVHDVQSIIASAPATIGESARKYLDELIWREFYHAVLFHFPHVVSTSFRAAFEQFHWSDDQRMLNAWCAGRTGFPLVDAGMRELAQTGWMHNRVRMVVASFLVKDLLIDWRKGEAHFAALLLDLETASNNGGWQWGASCGVDQRPLRIFNPTLQAEKYDPDGAYIRRFVPELARVDTRYIHAPHTMPPLLQAESGCVIDRDYPAPIVDHRASSNAFKEEYARLSRRAAD
jgi:deoxyribodipyrimidine photo-lyase